MIVADIHVHDSDCWKSRRIDCLEYKISAQALEMADLEMKMYRSIEVIRNLGGILDHLEADIQKTLGGRSGPSDKKTGLDRLEN